MKHLLSGRVRIILIVAILLSAALAILSNALGMNLPTMLTKAVMTPIEYGATALTEQAEKWYSYMFRYEALAAENEALKADIAQMEDVARQADTVNRENARLRDQLDFLSTHETYKTVDAYEATDDIVLEPLFTEFTLPGDKVNGQQLKTLEGLKITVEGHAIQRVALDTADAAWAAFDAQYANENP